MIFVPQMVMIGGNSRNSGKTTLACSIIKKLAEKHEVIGLKVTSVRPGEDDLHGNHDEEVAEDFTIYEEIKTDSFKDTSKMLMAGAAHVYYIRVTEKYYERAILHFLSKFINKQLIVCESRGLRGIISPGLFLMMIRLPVYGKAKDITEYIPMADKIFNFDEDSGIIKHFVTNLYFENDKFVWSR